MRWKPHVRFGERPGETGREQPRHRAPGRLDRLTRSAARMHANQLDPMVEDLQALPPKVGIPILAAWNCKEDLMDLLALTHTNPDRATIAERLLRFYAACADSGLKEMDRLATTIQTWWPQIEAAIRTGVNNAGSEGTNRVIKTDARAAFGYRSWPTCWTMHTGS